MKKRSIDEIREFQEKLKNDKKFAKEWEKRQQFLAEKIKNELFTKSFLKKFKM